MNKLQRQLVDMYAAQELDIEAAEELEAIALLDSELANDMHSLRFTVETLRGTDAIEMGEESFQRVLLKLYQAGVQPKLNSPEPAHWQYRLPLQG